LGPERFAVSGGGRNECSFGYGHRDGEGNRVDEKRSSDAERDINDVFAAGVEHAGVAVVG